MGNLLARKYLKRSDYAPEASQRQGKRTAGGFFFERFCISFFADVVEKKRVKKIFLSCGKLTRFSADEAGLFVVPKSLKIKRIKKSLRNAKIFLDKILLCGMLSLVEKCAPI